MATATIALQNKMQNDHYWQAGRLVVHTVGSDAGLMRLDIDLPKFSNTDDVMQKVKLIIPGETSPLTPQDAVGDNGRFILTFFSSDISNAGHVPAEAVATWEAPGHVQHKQHVNIESAERVRRTEGKEAVSIPGGERSAVYPQTVLLMTLLAVGVLIAAALLNLI